MPPCVCAPWCRERSGVSWRPRGASRHPWRHDQRLAAREQKLRLRACYCTGWKRVRQRRPAARFPRIDWPTLPRGSRFGRQDGGRTRVMQAVDDRSMVGDARRALLARGFALRHHSRARRARPLQPQHRDSPPRRAGGATQVAARCHESSDAGTVMPPTASVARSDPAGRAATSSTSSAMRLDRHVRRRAGRSRIQGRLREHRARPAVGRVRWLPAEGALPRRSAAAAAQRALQRVHRPGEPRRVRVRARAAVRRVPAAVRAGERGADARRHRLSHAVEAGQPLRCGRGRPAALSARPVREGQLRLRARQDRDGAS